MAAVQWQECNGSSAVAAVQQQCNSSSAMAVVQWQQCRSSAAAVQWQQQHQCAPSKYFGQFYLSSAILSQQYKYFAQFYLSSIAMPPCCLCSPCHSFHCVSPNYPPAALLHLDLELLGPWRFSACLPDMRRLCAKPENGWESGRRSVRLDLISTWFQNIIKTG